VKTDMVTREALFWDIPHGHSPGEAIFVPRPGAAEEDEDDGVLLSVVLDGHSRKSYLLCLDARTMTETGRAEVGFAVALGFHGVHVPC
jgi:torulene dioxygenase